MCDLRDLDIQSRAAVSLVAAWQGEHQAVRAVWKLEDVIQLLLRAIAGARELRARVQEGGPTSDDEMLRQNAVYFLETVQRIRAAANDAIRVIEMFESEGYSVDFSDDVRYGATAIGEILIETEALCERLEWQVLEKTALPSATIRAVAAHLASTGQASA